MFQRLLRRAHPCQLDAWPSSISGSLCFQSRRVSTESQRHPTGAYYSLILEMMLICVCVTSFPPASTVRTSTTGRPSTAQPLIACPGVRRAGRQQQWRPGWSILRLVRKSTRIQGGKLGAEEGCIPGKCYWFPVARRAQGSNAAVVAARERIPFLDFEKFLRRRNHRLETPLRFCTADNRRGCTIKLVS